MCGRNTVTLYQSSNHGTGGVLKDVLLTDI